MGNNSLNLLNYMVDINHTWCADTYDTQDWSIKISFLCVYSGIHQKPEDMAHLNGVVHGHDGLVLLYGGHKVLDFLVEDKSNPKVHYAHDLIHEE